MESRKKFVFPRSKGGRTTAFAFVEMKTREAAEEVPNSMKGDPLLWTCVSMKMSGLMIIRKQGEKLLGRWKWRKLNGR